MRRSPLGLPGLLRTGFAALAVLAASSSPASAQGDSYERALSARLESRRDAFQQCAQFQDGRGRTRWPAWVVVEADGRGRDRGRGRGPGPRPDAPFDLEVRSRELSPQAARCVERAISGIVGDEIRSLVRNQGSVRLRLQLPAVYGGPIVTPPPRPMPPQPIPSTPYVVNQPVEVQWGAAWYAARVTQVVSPTAYRIHYDGWADSWDEVVGLERIRAFGSPQPVPVPMPYPTPAPNGQNLVVNGGFEQPWLQPGTFTTVAGIPGWFITRGAGIEVQSGVAGRSFEGRQHVELDAAAATDLAQDVALVPGATYRLSVAFSARPGTPRWDNRMAVLIDGQTVLSIEADGTQRAETVWQVHTTTVVATAPRMRLELRDLGNPDGVGGYVDDVRLVRIR